MTFNDFMIGIFDRKDVHNLMNNRNGLFWIFLPSTLLLPILMK